MLKSWQVKATERFVVRGPEVRAERVKLRMTQQQLAAKAGWTKGYQSRIECSSEFELGRQAFERLSGILGEKMS